ncbi:MAG: WecB/TagA/CpsF family glycosyltransferase [Pirellulaceae bacterium]|nr:WecB/TagA/CpsF family glycosyltransferase [Pirellulaceae bacterium]
MQQAVDMADRVVQARRPEYFITANLNYLMLSDQHPRLHEVNRQCCCMLADGQPIVLRSRLGNQPLPARVAGSDLIVELAKLSAEKGYRIFFLGGAPGIASAASAHLKARFPEMQIAGVYSPPFRPLSAYEQTEMIRAIRDAETDILLVAFGQPKGELWIYDNLQDIGVPLAIQMGASFDFLAGTARRAPRIWQNLGCEWLYRALSDPRRLLPRYGKNLMFLLYLLLQDIKNVGQRKIGSPVKDSWREQEREVLRPQR